MASESTLFFCLQLYGLAPLATKMDDLRNWKDSLCGLAWHPSQAEFLLCHLQYCLPCTIQHQVSVALSLRSRVTDTGMGYAG